MRTFIIPSLVDVHVHLREPGQCWKGDIAHETAAAYHAGFETIVALPNTTPAIDTPDRWLEQQERLARDARVEVFQCAAMTLGRAGKVPVDAAALKEVGVRFLSDEGATPADLGVMREVVARAKDAGLPLIDHCEDAASTREGECRLVERDIQLAADTGVSFHLQHLSTAEAVEMLRQAKKDGLPVSGEVTPHHLALTEEAVQRWGSNAKMSPPLRKESDRQALIEGLVAGTLEVIATDHAPHTAEEKGRPFAEAPNGIIGLEASLPVCCEVLVRSGRMTLEALLERMTDGPRRVLHLPPARKKLVLSCDLEKTEYIHTSSFHSKSLNCPWEGFAVPFVKAVWQGDESLQESP